MRKQITVVQHLLDKQELFRKNDQSAQCPIKCVYMHSNNETVIGVRNTLTVIFDLGLDWHKHF